MPWSLLEHTAGSQEAVPRDHFNLQANSLHHIVLNDTVTLRLSVVEGSVPVGQAQKLASISLGPWGVRLQPLDDDVGVVPAYPRSNSKVDPPSEEYKLRKSTNSSVETIFLRENDRIYLSKCSSNLTLIWHDPEVQVTSSAIGEAEIADTATPEVWLEKLDPETEEDDLELDLDQTITAVEATQSHPASRTTPVPSMPRTDIVQETPTADRLSLLNKDSVAINYSFDVTNNTPTHDQIELTSRSELFSTARNDVVANDDDAVDDTTNNGELLQSPSTRPTTTFELPTDIIMAGHDEAPNERDEKNNKPNPESLSEPSKQGRIAHPVVRIPAKIGLKRSSPVGGGGDDADVSDQVTPRQAKRSRKATDDSILSNIDVDNSDRKLVSKRGTHGLSEGQETTSSKTPGSSSHSGVNGLYSGPKPVVAFSNSAIPQMQNILKFLKRHGGQQVDAVERDECNLLCVKNEPLKKSMKLLLCIALGIPIVTDAWLTDSAKKGQFLDLEAYMPSISQQEREINFSLSEIWGVPQSDLFEGKTVYFTPQLRNIYHPFSEVARVCEAVGATQNSSKSAKDVKKDVDTIILARDENDPEVAVFSEKGHTAYSKDLLTYSILRGGLDLDSDEFKIKPGGSQPKKRGRPRKS